MSRIAWILAFCFISITTTLIAQDGRTLHWRRVDVDSRIDSEGRLHVRERQAMVFTGDWNGGERTFNIRPGEKLDFHGMTRIDPKGGARALTAGDLDAVDHYDFTDSETLRWRSRLPGDPAFLNQEIIYELDYTLSNVLIADGDDYRLTHDFNFPLRDGIIEHFALVLDADDVWKTAAQMPFRLEQNYLEPGQSVVVTMALQYTGSGRPSGVQRALGLPTRLIIVMAILGILASMLRRFFEAERERGRFEPLTPVPRIDNEWLDKHIFSLPPEVVGAIWDSTTSAPEVAAMISRMVLEGKLTSRVETKRFKNILHLELMVARSELPPDERRLIDALFVGGTNTTDTKRIGEHYKQTGFDPAGLINDGIQKQVNAIIPARKGARNWRRITINVLVVLVVGFTGISALVRVGGSFAPFGIAAFGLLALILGGVYRSSVTGTLRKARRMAVCLLLSAAPIIALASGLVGNALISLSMLITLSVMFVGIAYLVLQAASTANEDPKRFERRRTLCAGREYFKHELAKKQPRLEDNWYPYLLAFGLGKHIDKWFKAFGPADDGSMISSTGMAVAASSGGWSGGGPLFGGGGGFGGGGTGRTWAAAADTLSSGVSSPSDSSSSGGGGGGGGGGGSSGGGGGGGW